MGTAINLDALEQGHTSRVPGDTTLHNYHYYEHLFFSSSTASSVSDVEHITEKLSALSTGYVYRSERPEKIYHSNFESLDLTSDPLVLTRQALQDKILDHNEKRLLVTAPPASGKSSMMALLTSRLDNENKQVFLLDTEPPKDEKAQRSALRGEFRAALYSQWIKRWSSGDGIALHVDTAPLNRVLNTYSMIDIASYAAGLFSSLNSTIELMRTPDSNTTRIDLT
ncbi:hypothetical protein BDZ88DRAFT_508964 [Geranomyces variabilis]|nr:hypothetical protein BDZ88DRAFT_508964 [Geranomyces variabilis]KAJ3135818.1 hypothetical protein HDU90_003557 [Geranomyces variabilis]